MMRSLPSAVAPATPWRLRARSRRIRSCRLLKSCVNHWRLPPTFASTQTARSRYWNSTEFWRIADVSTLEVKPDPAEETPRIEDLTPRQIVNELDKYIVGQHKAKRAVAIALRNRWRRQKVDEDLREEIMPNNIILIGPTGVGKTEIARRLARLAGAPFVKVEASKFTEVGYVGRDVESMVRDLVDFAVNLVREEREADVEETAQQRVEERLLDLLLPPAPEAEAPKPVESPRIRAFVVAPEGP